MNKIIKKVEKENQVTLNLEFCITREMGFLGISRKNEYEMIELSREDCQVISEYYQNNKDNITSLKDL